MTTRDFDPRRLDVAAFARQAGRLQGAWPLAEFTRLAEIASPESPPAASDRAVWTAQGEGRPVRGAEPQPWLHLHGEATMALVCQRCLGPVTVALDVERSFLFVAGEDEAARLDEESDDDVVALSAALDLRDLLEDELLLAVPLVPRHEVCPVPLVVPPNDEIDADPPSPFAALAALKRGDPPG